MLNVSNGKIKLDINHLVKYTIRKCVPMKYMRITFYNIRCVKYVIYIYVQVQALSKVAQFETCHTR